ncbi:sulfate transporter CysZ [Candidatus Venteria ishoeyi]|uniref:Putative sulfate transport protein CysZ n=1 Tax=Candidatus Venteria ishoeyi TaxID=1899563 RepID=A0A1H6FGF7_9GAMM|nr:sulfate transporter CysZ [Candidatus Venteria ishoeyi]SEH09160.1 putative sulfate transport protein CysZ [Candidatus Venteria ishoeyi]SEH09289.1 putative sulfate transport protein CysZ [Candidatus Venteria ishoeyi]
MAPKKYKFDILDGLLHLFSGFGLITQKGIRQWVLIPLLINVVLFAGLIIYTSMQMDLLAVSFENWLPNWLDWLSILLWPLFILSVVMFVFFGFTFIANFIAAPFNALLSAAVERHLTGQEPSEAKTTLWAMVIGSLLDELRKLTYNLLRLLPILILFIIPGLQLIAPVLLFLFTIWMLTLQYVDYPMGNNGLNFKTQREYLRKRRLLSLSFGSGTFLITLIPGLNLLVIPVAVAGATRLWVKEFTQQ